MTYKARCALAALLALAIVYGLYFRWAWQPGHSEPAILRHMMGAAGLLAVMSAGLTVCMTLPWRQARGEDERDRANGWRSTRNAYFLLVSLIWAAPFAMLAGLAPAVLANLCLAGLVVAEMARYGSWVIYDVRGR